MLQQGTGDLRCAPDAHENLLMVGRASRDEEEFLHKAGQKETNFLDMGDRGTALCPVAHRADQLICKS